MTPTAQRTGVILWEDRETELSIINIEIACDDSFKDSALKVPCGARLTLTGADSAKTAIHMASLVGWKNDLETGLDYCPTCSQLLDIGGSQKQD